MSSSQSLLPLFSAGREIANSMSDVPTTRTPKPSGKATSAEEGIRRTRRNTIAIIEGNNTPLPEDQSGLEQSIADRVSIYSPPAEVPAYVVPDKLAPISEKTESPRASPVPDDSGPPLAVSNGLNFYETFAEFVNNSPRVQALSQVGIGAWCTAERVEAALGRLSRMERKDYGVAEYLRDYYPAPDETDRDGSGINDDSPQESDSVGMGVDDGCPQVTDGYSAIFDCYAETEQIWEIDSTVWNTTWNGLLFA
ncbi:hypothetical protein FPQ18DRAFT_308581 [Pyronema domesticum]|nr:hypothetical protein FPQ18DRAFT_308581 [Pyronema domesticum]